MSELPALPRDRWSNSWVVTRCDSGEVLGEFYDSAVITKLDRSKMRIETAHAYLCRFNKAVANA